jgi:hypothetical protein
MKTNGIHDDGIKGVQLFGGWIAKQVHLITEVDDSSGRGVKYRIDSSRALPVFHTLDGQLPGRMEVADTGERNAVIQPYRVRPN